MAINTQGAAQRHIKLSLGRLTFNNTTQTFDPEIKKQTAATSIWFRYDGYPLYLEEVKVSVNETPMRRMSSHFLNNGSIELSGDVIRISTLRCFPGSILNNFLECVQKPKKVEVGNKTAVAYIRPKIDRARWDDPDAWQYQTGTSRPLSTIDLDPKVKDDLINTVDQLLLPSGQHGINVAEPPPGYLRDTTNPPSLHQELAAVGISTTVIALVAVVLRVFTRVRMTT